MFRMDDNNNTESIRSSSVSLLLDSNLLLEPRAIDTTSANGGGTTIDIVERVDLSCTFDTPQKLKDLQDVLFQWMKTTTTTIDDHKNANANHMCTKGDNDKNNNDLLLLMDPVQYQQLSQDYYYHQQSPTRKRRLSESMESTCDTNNSWLDTLTIVSDSLDQVLLLDDNDQQEPPCKKSCTTFSSASSTTETSPASRLRPFQKDLWMQRYHQLVSFYQHHGHCIPSSSSSMCDLNEWVKRQRYQYKLWKQGKKSTMTEHRMDLLNKIQFTWDLHDLAWEAKFRDLVAFGRLHAHVNVPISHGSLGIWVKGQRHHYRKYCKGQKSTMTKDRVDRLNALGFVWNSRESSLAAVSSSG